MSKPTAQIHAMKDIWVDEVIVRFVSRPHNGIKVKIVIDGDVKAGSFHPTFDLPDAVSRALNQFFLGRDGTILTPTGGPIS